MAPLFAAALGGPLDPDSAARTAAAIPAARLPEPERLTTLDEEPGGVRSLLGVFGRQSAASPDVGTPGPLATPAIPTHPEALP